MAQKKNSKTAPLVEADYTYEDKYVLVSNKTELVPHSARYRLACYREERLLRNVMWLNSFERVEEIVRQSKGGTRIYDHLVQRYRDQYISSYDYRLYCTNMTASPLPIAVGQMSMEPVGYHVHATEPSVEKHLVLPGERIMISGIVRTTVDYRETTGTLEGIRRNESVNKLYVSSPDQGFIIRELVTFEFVFCNRQHYKVLKQLEEEWRATLPIVKVDKEEVEQQQAVKDGE